MDERQEALLDTWLDNLPRVALPPHFVAQVQRRITATPFTPWPFRLQLLDIAIPIFVTLFVVLMMWYGRVETGLFQQWHLTWQSFQITLGWRIGIMAIGLELLVLTLLAWQWVEEP